MRAIYRTSFRLKASIADLPAIAGACLDWVFDPERKSITRFAVRPKNPLVAQARLDLGNKHELALRTVTGDEGPLGWGMQFSHPDFEDSNLRWAVEATLRPAQNGSLHLACSMLIGRTDLVVMPVQRFTTRPKLIPKLLAQFQSDEAFPVSAAPLTINAETAPLLARFLESQTRRHPVVFVSTFEGGQVMCDVEKLADQLAGLAHVIVATEDAVGEALSRHLSDRMNCFDGGVRIYWPGFTAASNPYHHPLYIRRVLFDLRRKHPAAISQMLLEKLAAIAAFAVPESFLTWQRLEALEQEKVMRRAQEAGDWETLAKNLQARQELMQHEMLQLRAELAGQAVALQTAKAEAEQWKTTYFALASGSQDDASSGASAPPPDVQSVIDTMTKDFSEELVFCLNTKSGDYDDFASPGEVQEALFWLASTYRDAKSGKTPCANLDKSIKETVPGWFFSGGQSDTTVGQFKEWYQTTYEGQKVKVHEHIGCGSSKDARHTIRIAFTWLPNEKKVLIGFIGQHQRNRAT